MTDSTNPLTSQWCPDKCPISGRPFFMWIEHPQKGMVPTYGGPLDSYTLAERDHEGTFQCERYDHDEGAWRLDVIEWIDLRLVDGQSAISSDGEKASSDRVEGVVFEDSEQRRKLSKPIPLNRGDDVEVFLLHSEPATEDERGAWYPAKFVALCLSKVSPEPIVQRAGSMPIYGTWNGVRLPAGKKLIVAPQQKTEQRKPFMFVQLHAGDVMDWTLDPNLADVWKEEGHTVANLFTEAT